MKSVLALVLIGWAAAASAQPDARAALAALEQAAAATPNDVDVLRRLGIAQGQSGQTREALATLERARQLAPDDYDVRLALAQVHYYRGESAAALRLAGEVLAAHPENGDARDLAERARRAVRAGYGGERWRLDLSGSYSDFNDDARRRWLESSIGLGYRVDERTNVFGRAEVADRFGKTDIFGEVGGAYRFGDASSADLAVGVTPGADFLPQWAVRGGLRARAWQGGVGDGVLTLDARYAEYRSGGVETLSPGIEQYLAGGRLWLTGRAIFTWDENGNSQTGYLARGDAQVAERVRLFAGYADAPETSENVTLTTRTLFGGAVVELSDRHTLRLDYARDDRESSYVRNAFTLGFGVRF